MKSETKIRLGALSGLVCAALSLLHPVWLAGAAICLLLLWKLASEALCDSQTDALTGLGNLRRLEHRRSHYEKCPDLTVFYLDLDNLKAINDTHGHDAGNAALKQVAALISGVGADSYRIGGDEFLLIAETADHSALVDRWNTHAAACAVPISYGVARGSGPELDALIARADRNMYDGK